MQLIHQLRRAYAHPDLAYYFLYWHVNDRLLHRATLRRYIPAYGVRMNIRVRDDIGQEIWFGGFEREVHRFLSRYLQPGMVFFDVGANIGLFTLVGANRVGFEGQVHAFEPSEREVDRLQANVELNSLRNVTVNRVAVVDTVGTIDFAICADNYGAFNAVRGVSHPKARDRIVGIKAVPATTLDAYKDSCGLRSVDLIKIDVEGSELAVLQGAHSILKSAKAPALVCEFSSAAGSAERSSAVWELARNYGYRWFELGQDGTLQRELTKAPAFEYANLVATKRALRW